MHHRGQLMLIERMLGIVPHLTRADAGAVRRGAAGPRVAAAIAVHQEDARVPAGAQAEQRSRVVPRAQGLSTSSTSAVRWSRCSASSRAISRRSRRTSSRIRASAMFRIYRDTRFSHDKRPLKTNVAAHFPSRKFPKGEGAGLTSRSRRSGSGLAAASTCRRQPSCRPSEPASRRIIGNSTAWSRHRRFDRRSASSVATS